MERGCWEDQVGDGHCKPDCGSGCHIHFASPRLSRLSHSAPPVCEDGIWLGFNHPRGASIFVIFGRKHLCHVYSGQTLIEQYQRDDNVLTLVEAMHDAFDFAQHEDTLKSIKPDSKQAEILTLMLQDVCSCSDFIQSY